MVYVKNGQLHIDGEKKFCIYDRKEACDPNCVAFEMTYQKAMVVGACDTCTVKFHCCDREVTFTIK